MVNEEGNEVGSGANVGVFAAVEENENAAGAGTGAGAVKVDEVLLDMLSVLILVAYFKYFSTTDE